jgi:hypothetical protein
MLLPGLEAQQLAVYIGWLLDAEQDLGGLDEHGHRLALG